MRSLLKTATPGLKISCLLLFMLIGLFIAGVFAELILSIPGLKDFGEISNIYVNSITQSIFAIALPSCLIVALTDSEPAKYFKVYNDSKLPFKMFFALLVFIFSYLFASFLSQLNRGMVLPDCLKGVEDVMRSMEEAALEATNLLLSGKSIGSLILNLIVVAGLAAVSEELFFRGAMQQFIQERLKNGHASVWLTALIFSFVHFQFYGFLPRLFLGAVLGYLFLYTRNLWVPILFHFLNNATVIIINFFWGQTEWYKSIEDISITPKFVGLAIVSLALTMIMFWVYNKQSINKN